MIKEEILSWYKYSELASIYAYLQGSKSEGGKIVDINKGSLYLSDEGDAFIYKWGWYDHGCNVYRFEDYGETWAFTREELEE